MSRKKRGMLASAAVLGLLLAIEVGVNLWSGPSATVQIDNLEAEPIEDVEVILGDSRVGPSKLEPRGSARFEVHGRSERTLVVKFRRHGNARTSYELPGFNPASVNEQGARLILQIRADEIIRFQDEAEPCTAFGRFSHYLRHKAWNSLFKEYIPY